MSETCETYTPDSWVVLKVKAGKGTFPFYKVLAGWSGGYLSGDSWRINSGITRVEDDRTYTQEIDEIDDKSYRTTKLTMKNYYEFYGESGSCYRCHKGSYGLRMSTADVYKKMYLQREFDGQIILMPADTDWSKLV